MCQRCFNAVKSAMKNGVSEEVAMDFLWNETPFPFGEPAEDQLLRLATLGAPPKEASDE